MRNLFKKFTAEDANAPVYEHCSGCGKPIHEGEPYWSVQYARETYQGGSVSVHEAVAVALFCGACAEQRDLNKIEVPLKA